jgi:putative membrane protein
VKKIIAITIILLLIIVGIGLYKIFYNENDSKDLKGAEAYLNDPKGYMNKLKEKYKVDLDESEHSDHVQRPKGYYEKLEKELTKMDKITVNEANYIPIMNIIDRKPELFMGKELEMAGFIYREPEFSNEQFVIGRLGYSCCVESEDAVIYGILSTTTVTTNLPDDQWLEVSGILNKTEYNGIMIPHLEINELELLESPENPYVYEFYDE